MTVMAVMVLVMMVTAMTVITGTEAGMVLMVGVGR